VASAFETHRQACHPGAHSRDRLAMLLKDKVSHPHGEEHGNAVGLEPCCPLDAW